MKHNAIPPKTSLTEGSRENLVSFVFFPTTAFMAAHHHTLLRLYTCHLTLNHVAVSGLHQHQHYSCRQHNEPL